MTEEHEEMGAEPSWLCLEEYLCLVCVLILVLGSLHDSKMSH